jgi:hypothetical protein
MTFEEAVVTLIDIGDTREAAEEFLSDGSNWERKA